MTIYKLEEDPTIFIIPTYYGNRFVYRMTCIRESKNRTIIRNIDLRKDKLMVHGTEIKESKLQRLHDSLTLEQKQGHIYVNCDGACYFLLIGKSYLCKPIRDAVFDWSPFGVVVPDSINESLIKELKSKDNEIDTLNRQLLSTMASLQEAKNEAKELQEQVLAHVKTQKNEEMKLKKVSEQLSLVDFELESNKIELESSKKIVLELKDQLSTCKEECQNMKNELQNQLSLSKKANDDFVTQLKNLHEELSVTKTQLRTLQDQLSLNNDQLESSKVLLECSQKEVQELKNQSCLSKEEHHHMSDKVRKISEDLHSINSEVRSNNQKLEQVLISMLWNEFVLGNQFQPRLLSQPSLMSSIERDRGTTFLVSSEDEGQNLGYMVPNNRHICDATNNLPVFIKIEEIEEGV